MQRPFQTTPAEYNDVGTQALVTANFGITEAAMKARLKAMEEGKLANTTAYPQTLGTTGAPFAFVNILPGEILVTYKQLPRGRPLTNGSTVQAAEVFSSFAGLRFADIEQPPRPFPSAPAIDMRAQVRKQFTAVGVSAIPYRYGEATQKQAGISGAVGGSMSMVNTGFEQIATGDKIMWDAPPTSDTPRERELVTLFKRNNPGYTYAAKTMTMPLTRQTFGSMLDAAWDSLDKKMTASAADVDIIRTRTGLDADEQLALDILIGVRDATGSNVLLSRRLSADIARLNQFLDVVWLFHESVLSRIVATALSSAAPGQKFVAHIHI
jgi:hypothetical protein